MGQYTHSFVCPRRLSRSYFPRASLAAMHDCEPEVGGLIGGRLVVVGCAGEEQVDACRWSERDSPCA